MKFGDQKFKILTKCYLLFLYCALISCLQTLWCSHGHKQSHTTERLNWTEVNSMQQQNCCIFLVRRESLQLAQWGASSWSKGLSLVVQTVKNPPSKQETWVWPLGRERSPREGSGYPRQYPCLENPRDRGAWWAAIYGVSQGWTRLKWLSGSSLSSWTQLSKYKAR